jgi:hypothetical protein
MREGWRGEDYLILFDASEVADTTRRYELAKYIADHEIVGLKGWDDFIVRDSKGGLFTIPTVPLDRKYLVASDVGVDGEGLVADNRIAGNIKWYTKPLIFGGDPSSRDNICWITLDQHIEDVKWWNRIYREVGGSAD